MEPRDRAAQTLRGDGRRRTRLVAWSAVLVALAFAVAASANLPALLYNLFWKRFNTRGATWSIYGGLISCITLVIFSPVVSGKGLDPTAAQVVMTHESVHALTSAPLSSSAPLWLVEGFADYVALRRDDAPLAVSAGQALAQVRADGPPRTLPDADTFAAAGGHGLGAVYESAWLVFRMLAQERSNESIVAFYESVRDGADVAGMLRLDEHDGRHGARASSA